MAKEFDIAPLNRDFESRVRLGIMSVLMVNGWVSFLEMKQMLDLSDGNLASHALQLEQKGYLEVRKAFVGKKTETSYRITPFGNVSFKKHVDALEQLLKSE
jgi:DNA-binding HxlR family transcriptional regulator